MFAEQLSAETRLPFPSVITSGSANGLVGEIRPIAHWWNGELRVQLPGKMLNSADGVEVACTVSAAH